MFILTLSSFFTGESTVYMPSYMLQFQSVLLKQFVHSLRRVTVGGTSIETRTLQQNPLWELGSWVSNEEDLGSSFTKTSGHFDTLKIEKGIKEWSTIRDT